MKLPMDIRIIFISLSILITQSLAQDEDDGLYHPEKYPSPDGDDGHYVHDTSGQYVHDDSGRYLIDRSGDYHPQFPRYYNGPLYKLRNTFRGRFNNFLERNSTPRKYEETFSNRKAITNPQSRENMRNYNDEENKLPESSFTSIPKSTGRNLKPSFASSLLSLKTSRFEKESDNEKDNLFGDFAAGTAYQPKTSHNIQRAAPAPYNQARYKTDGQRWRILKQNGDISSDGYHWDFETENGIQAEETGKVDNIGSTSPIMRAKGQFKYTGPDNVVYTVIYTADENGFVAQGQHLPTPPPIPEAIVKSLEFIRSGNPPRGKF